MCDTVNFLQSLDAFDIRTRTTAFLKFNFDIAYDNNCHLFPISLVTGQIY